MALTAKHLPGGATAAFSPDTLSTSVPTSTLTVTTTAKTHHGRFHFTVTGALGKAKYDVVAQLTVLQPPMTGFTVATSPDKQQIAAGGTTTYAVGIARSGGGGDVTLSADGLPDGAVATFTPKTTSDDSSVLVVSTDPVFTPDGDFTLTITGMGGSITASTTVHLKIKSPDGKTFGISGDVGDLLYPGASPAAIDLQLANPNDKAIWITNLTVQVDGASNSCSADNFAVQQYTGGYPLRIEKRETHTLSELGVPSDLLPTLQLRDLPNTDQDACKDATVTLSYAGSAREAH